jgi:hypothetical protein
MCISTAIVMFLRLLCGFVSADRKEIVTTLRHISTPAITRMPVLMVLLGRAPALYQQTAAFGSRS